MSAPSLIPEQYREILQFLPRILPDPAPEWWLRNLDKSQIQQVAKIHFEYQQAVLNAQKIVIDAQAKALAGMSAIAK